MGIFWKSKKSNAQVVVVTKYLDAEKTKEIWQEIGAHKEVWGLGENRVDALIQKNMPREKVHFIGNIQSRKIPEIVRHSSVVHSLQKVEHAEKFASTLHELEMGFFIQINISREPQKSGILPEDLGNFLEKIKPFELDIMGISAMGAGEFDADQKRREFRELVSLRDIYLPGKLISAGTSRDYEIALEEGIDVVRVGRGFFEE
ncbi:hypothetical protein HC823_00185 [Candidatus Gracilibacteria bacterium]|nr:hypothetical protein [Candidatus Gracilibacteria bacterium]